MESGKRKGAIVDFELSDDQRSLFDTIAGFARDVVEPGARARDKSSEFDKGIWERCAEVGLTGICLPEEYGGGGADALTTGLALEALAYGGRDSGLNLSLGAHLTIGSWPIVDYGTTGQCEKWLPPLCAGEAIGALAITEPEAGSDTASIATTAVRDGQQYVLNGSKTFCTNGSIADVIIIIAVSDSDAPASQRMTAFLIEPGMDGVTFGPDLHKMGNRSSPTSEVFLDHVVVGQDSVLGPPGEALWRIGFECFDRERTIMIASIIGMMARDLDQTISYATQREAFGEPIGRFGSIQEKIADMRVNLEAARLLQRQAAWLLDQGLPHRIEASAAKVFVGDAAVEGALHAVQVHGGWGYIDEFDVERSVRDAKLGSIGGGTSEIQRMIIARSLMGLERDKE